MRYCRHCFGVSQKCQCSANPHQAPGPRLALWTPPMVSYTAMVSSTKTTASTSVAGVTRLSCLPPGIPPLKAMDTWMPPLEAMDTLPAPTSENLLATAGVGRGGRTQSQLRTPTTPGIRQMRPRAPQQLASNPGRREATQTTPYRQQVYPPQHATPKLSTAPSTSQGHVELAREDENARGRSSSQGPQNRQWRNRSSTRGSRKHRRGIRSDDAMDEMSGCMRRVSSSGEMASPVEINGGGPLVSASPRGPEGSGSPYSSSSAISMLAISSSSWQISSSSSWQISSSMWASSSSMWWTSSSSIRQSSMRFLNFVIDLSTMLREVCRVFNLCFISLRDNVLVTTSMVFNTALNSLQSLVRLLWHFCREEVASVHFFSLCLLFFLRTWSITPSNWRSQVVPGARK